MDGDTGYTFGCSSPRIDGDIDKRYSMVSMGTHTLVPLTHHLQAQTISMLSFDTLGASMGGQGAHRRYWNDTQRTKGKTSQRWHWVSARVENHKLGNEVIICRGGISFITEPTPRELVTRETCVTLFSGHVGTKHEHRIPGTTEVASQYVSGLQTLYWHII